MSENSPTPLDPVAAYVDVETAGDSHVGKIRESNEDHFLVAALERRLEVEHSNLPSSELFERRRHARMHLLAVADGVASSRAGERASQAAIEAVAAHLAALESCFTQFEVDAEHDFLEELEGAVRRAHHRIRAGKSATTLTLVVILWPRAYVIHLGDSRAYHMRGSRYRQLTRDQTMPNVLLDRGVISAEQARRSGAHNVLASALGGQFDPAIGLIDLEPGDTLLLCTDGLSKHVEDEEMAAALASTPDCRTACRQLLDLALDRGGTDNVTVVVARTI
ncbi:MAG: PP2C family protein-serine/threonine phosphatase [Thermoanaerobaculia bacterium]